jgi:putative mRNA 3-end processing factor
LHASIEAKQVPSSKFQAWNLELGTCKHHGMRRVAERAARSVRREAGGYRLAGTALHIDAQRPRELGFVTHAHSDHVASHERTLATPTTLALMGIPRATGSIPCQYRTPFSLGELRLEALPAGHLPGSAQLLVEHNSTRILFSSDIYDGEQRFAEPLTVTRCDVLVVEATYGTVRHRFPSRKEAADQLCEEVERALEDGGTPLVLVEGSLGRAQEILAELAGDGHKLVVSKSIFRWNELYRRLGMAAADCRRYGGRPERGSVLVYPMRSRGLKGLSKIRRLVKIACTGQVPAEKACHRLGVNRVVPFVDHADFDGLVRFVAACKPKKVLTTHGYTEELAQALSERGFDAEPLVEPPQLSLSL